MRRPSTLPDQTPDAQALAELLAFLRDQRSVDFSGYEKTTLERRIDARLDELGISDRARYIDHLARHPDEFDRLFDSLLLTGSSFLWGTPVWERLRNECLPAVLSAKAGSGPVRVWATGSCAGHDAYSATILATELLGRPAALERLKVYATDSEAEALGLAGRGWFPRLAVEGLPATLRERYLQPVDGIDGVDDGFVFGDDELRRRMVFGHHDLLRDAPISGVDLVLCRNVFMYLTADVQVDLAKRLHLALSDHGYLVMGDGETLSACRDLFQPLHENVPIFSKEPIGPAEERMVALYLAEPPSLSTGDEAQALAAEAFEQAVRPQLVIDQAGHLALANRAARAALQIDPSRRDLPLAELGGLSPLGKLGPALEEATARQRPIVRRDLFELPGGAPCAVEIVALRRADGRTAHLFSFLDMTDTDRSRAHLQKAQRELDEANTELLSMNEESERVSAELQSTVEELETTSAELRSTTDALGRMNEELAASQRELLAMDQQLQGRTRDE